MDSCYLRITFHEGQNEKEIRQGLKNKKATNKQRENA
jgi:hypothetical protein